jgi:hypothetical protein
MILHGTLYIYIYIYIYIYYFLKDQSYLISAYSKLHCLPRHHQLQGLGPVAAG